MKIFFTSLMLVLAGILPLKADSACSAVDFNLAPSYESGSNTVSSATGDFNGDGTADIAFVNADLGFSVVIGDGAGGYGPPKFYPFADFRPWRLTAGDLNGDGKSDLIIAAGTPNKLATFVNNGSGGFGLPTIYTPPTPFPNQGEYQEMASGDFNGDGKTDVVVTQYQSARKLRFFLGDGQGNIALGQTIDLVGNDSRMVVGNLNGDAMTDVVLGGSENSGLRYVGYVLGAANGVFNLAKFINGIVDMPVAITIGDFNNDTGPDIVVAFRNYNTEHYLQPYLNQAGAYVAQPKISLTYLLDPFDLTSGDYDGDGKRDLAVMIGAGLIVTENGLGNGTFQNERLWTIPEGNAVYTIDADRNNKPDLVTVQHRGTNSNLISVMKNNDFAGFEAPEPIFYGENAITSGDLNNDNLLDMITAPAAGFGPGGSYIAWALNNGARSFLPAHTVDNGPSNIKALRTGDFNGDNKLDVFSAHGNNNRMLEVYLGDGTGTLATGIPTALNVIWNDAVVADFNGDGKTDVFAVSESGLGYSLLGTGTGTFTIAPNFPITIQNDTSLISLQKGDVNGDGKVDIITNGFFNSTGVVNVYAGVGNGQFNLLTPNAAPLMKSVVADLNGDGKLDLAGFASGVFPTMGLTGVLGTGTGTFGPPFTLNVTGFEIRNLIAGDFNDDGMDDVAYVQGISNGSTFVVVPSAAGGATPSWGTPSVFPYNPVNITAADFDRDGKTDLGFSNGISRGVYHNTSGNKPCLSIDDASITEGETATVNAAFAVHLSAPATQTVRVNYTLQMQTATLDADVEPVSGRLEIPAGQTSAIINVPVKGDLLDEDNETFKVNLAGVDNASIKNSSALGTIIDNDAPPTLTVSDVSRSESTAGSSQYQFTISLSAPSGRTVGFRYATADGTATGGESLTRDYFSQDRLWTLAPGATSMTIGISVITDATYELDETFFVNVTEPSNLTIADGQGQGTILNDDPVPTLSTNGGAFLLEKDTGTTPSQVQLFLSNPTYLPVTVNYSTANGTAVGGADYVAANGSIVIPAEQQFVNLELSAIGDTINEPNETFTLNLSANNIASQPAALQGIVFDDEPVSNDFDLDGKTDIAVFRPSDRTWYRLFSSNGAFGATVFGLGTDIPVSGDYNGNGNTDIAVWRPSVGTWFPLVSPSRTQVWGQNGDIPVPGDYDNDTKTDVAVFRPSDHSWYIQMSSNGAYLFLSFGLAGDIPVQADYDGDGKTDIAVFRPSEGTWYILRSSDNGFVALNWGLSTDLPVAADYDGDGKADVAVFRDGDWYVYRSSDSGFTAFHWGQAGDKPVPGNYDGDAKTDFAVYRGGTWWIYRSSTNDFVGTAFGLPDDIPIPSVSR